MRVPSGTHVSIRNATHTGKPNKFKVWSAPSASYPRNWGLERHTEKFLPHSISECLLQAQNQLPKIPQLTMQTPAVLWPAWPSHGNRPDADGTSQELPGQKNLMTLGEAGGGGVRTLRKRGGASAHSSAAGVYQGECENGGVHMARMVPGKHTADTGQKSKLSQPIQAGRTG